MNPIETLPVAKPMSIPLTGKHRPTVFLVDDDEDDQFLLQRIFTKHFPTCFLRAVNDGLELLEALEAVRELPALVVMDLNMPVMNGFEALEQIRQRPRYQQLPVVVLTTSYELRDRQRARQLGANGFLTKPLLVADYHQIVLQLGSDWL